MTIGHQIARFTGLTAILIAAELHAAEDEITPQGPVRVAAQPIPRRAAPQLGHRIDDARLTTLDHTDLSIHDAIGPNGLVIVTREETCPLCMRYGPAIARLEDTWSARGIPFLYVNFTTADDADTIRQAAARYGFDGPYIHDPAGHLGRSLQITSTTEVLALDRTGTLVYRGAVDDQYGIGYQRQSPRHTYLDDALNAILGDSRPTVEATTAPGCVLKFDETNAGNNQPALPDVTYHQTISRIMLDNCVSCHRDGGPAPFALDTPEHVKARRGMIDYVISEGIMPPWGANDTGGPWINDRRLPDHDQAALLEWLDGEMPLGDPDHAPVARVWPDEWQIGTPDLIVETPIAFRVPAEGTLDYRNTYIETTLDRDRWVQAIEIQPSAPQVVHHVLVFIEEPRRPDESRRDFQRRSQGGLGGYFAALVPGQGPTVFPDGFGRLLPECATLKFQIHYTPNGTETFDQTRVGLTFCDDAPDTEVRVSAVATTRFEIPAGADNHQVSASARFRTGGTLLGMSPHMHLRGKAFRVELEYPDGTRNTILDIPRYDFNWQTMYRFATPLDVPDDTRMICTAWYDNSADNPANPDPSRTVYFGEQTWDEMMIGYFEWYRK